VEKLLNFKTTLLRALNFKSCDFVVLPTEKRSDFSFLFLTEKKHFSQEQPILHIFSKFMSKRLKEIFHTSSEHFHNFL
jgi:hypothetical protein